ncbi:hypothetical protein DFH07DRAFT_772033 [Mycena maculata]|uniref:Uncharacterized protein n=1 Tax=Mycena maculata TaxID=230809 RepID=A0AAD7JA49_9AGAR|nr:hypothetical protein DFH07DRAFT_772033 [Mycena maculata]
MFSVAENEYLQALRKGGGFQTNRHRWGEEMAILRENLRCVHNLPPPTTDLQKGEIDHAHDLLTSLIFAIVTHFKNSNTDTIAETAPHVDEDDEDDEVPELMDEYDVVPDLIPLHYNGHRPLTRARL